MFQNPLSNLLNSATQSPQLINAGQTDNKNTEIIVGAILVIIVVAFFYSLKK